MAQSVSVWINSSESYSKDALFLGKLSCAEGPEVDMGFTAGDDIGAVAGVELHSKHSLISALKIQHIRNCQDLVDSTQNALNNISKDYF